MSGEGFLPSRPEGMPGAHAQPETRPFAVGRLGKDGVWRVLLITPVPGALAIETELDVEAAEKLAAGLLNYAKLIREKTGLPGGEPMP